MSRFTRLLAVGAAMGPLLGCAAARTRQPAAPPAAITLATPAKPAPAAPEPAAAAAPSEGGDPVTCTGRLSGAVTGTFTCDVTVTIAGDKATFHVEPLGGVPGVRTLLPADFELAMPLRAATYAREAVGGSAVVELEGGQRYTASARRGEVSLVLESAERYVQARNFYVVSGTLTAHLVGDGQLRGEVVVDLRF